MKKIGFLFTPHGRIERMKRVRQFHHYIPGHIKKVEYAGLPFIFDFSGRPSETQHK